MYHQQDHSSNTSHFCEEQQTNSGLSHCTGKERIRTLRARLDAALIRAVYHQDVQTASEALKQGADPNAEAEEGMNAIHFAALYGNLSLLKLLIDYNVDPNRLCRGSGLSPLHCTALMGHVSSARLLLEKGKADPDSISSLSGRTPLQIVASIVRPGSVEIASTLIQFGANVHVTEDDDLTLLHICGNDSDMVQLLAEAGLDPSSYSKREITPLHRACRNGHLRKVKGLVRAGAEVNNAGHVLKTPLHCACDGGHLDIVRFLVKEAHADVNARDRNGKLPIHQACKMKQTHVAEFFIDECGFCPSVQDTQGNTCLHWACRKVPDHRRAEAVLEIVEELLERVPSLLNVRNDEQQSVLHIAATWNVDLCRLLIHNYGANVTKKDLHGQTPLVFASRQGSTETVSYLADIATKHNFSLDSGDHHGWTPLHWACFRYNERMVRSLVDCGANPNVTTSCGRSPLHLISRFSIPAGFRHRDNFLDGVFDQTIVFKSRPTSAENHIVEILLKYGADSMATDKRGDLTFFMAASTGSLNDTFLMVRAATGNGLF